MVPQENVKELHKALNNTDWSALVMMSRRHTFVHLEDHLLDRITLIIGRINLTWLINIDWVCCSHWSLSVENQNYQRTIFYSQRYYNFVLLIRPCLEGFLWPWLHPTVPELAWLLWDLSLFCEKRENWFLWTVLLHLLLQEKPKSRGVSNRS